MRALTLPAAYFAGLVAVTVLYGLPDSRREWCIVFFGHVTAGFVTLLTVTGNFRWFESLVAESLYRLVIFGLWLMPVAAFLLICETVRRGKLRWHPVVPKALRFLLGGTMVLIGLEGSALLIERLNAARPIETELPEAPDGEVRVVTIGGSSMLGFPYEPDWSIGKVVVQQLGVWFPDRRFVLDNIAQTGVNLEQAVSRINSLQYLPSVLIVYSGHNEYFHNLEELKTARTTAWGAFDELLAWSPTFRVVRPIIAGRSTNNFRFPFRNIFRYRQCPAHVEQNRLARYRNHFRQLYQWAARNDVTVVHCVPASDEATFSPIQSLCKSSDDTVRTHLREKLNQAWDLLNDGRWNAALQLCQTTIQDEPNCAEFHFVAARCCRQLGDLQAARTYFKAAQDLDEFAMRMKTAYAEAGADEAQALGVPVVDCPELLRSMTEDGILDDRFFLDGVHPRLETYFVIGMAVAETVAASTVFDSHQPNEQLLRITYTDSIKRAAATTETLVRAYAKTGKVLKHYSEIRLADDPERLAAAEHFRSLASRLEEGTITAGEDGSESLTETVLPPRSVTKP